jgi:hypothetical protein
MFQDYPTHRCHHTDAQLNHEYDGEAIVALDSEEGQKRVTERMEQTVTARTAALENIADALAAASTVEEAAQDYTVYRTAAELGTCYHPRTTHLFDATGCTYGHPVLSKDRVNEIVNHGEDKNLHVVEVVLEY